MYRWFALSLCSLLLAACAPYREGQRGEGVNPLTQIGQAPGLLQQFPVLQTQPAPLGPAMDAYPVVDPPEVKRVWITAHDNAHGDRISGHYVDVLYQRPRFAPMPGGTARIPVAPQLTPFLLTNPTPAGTLLPHDRQSSPQSSTRPAALSQQQAVRGAATADLLQRIEQLRQAMPGQTQGVTLQPNRLEDAP